MDSNIIQTQSFYEHATFRLKEWNEMLIVFNFAIKYLKSRMFNQLAISSTVQKFYFPGIFSLLLAHVVVTSLIWH